MKENFLDSITYISYLIFFIAMLVEYIISKYKKDNDYHWRDTLVNIGTGVFGFFVPFLLSMILITFLYNWISQYAFFSMPGVWTALLYGEKTYLWAFIVLFLVDDFCFYWYHRILHVCRFFWCIHEVHHSSEKYNFSIFLRASFLDYVPQGLFWFPLFLLGFRLEDILIQISLSLFYQFWLHTKYTKKIFILDYIFNTPSHHRVHHSRNIVYLDKNFSGIFIFWDILFGTFAREKEEPEFGILNQINSYNVFIINLKSFIVMIKDAIYAPKLTDKIKYIFYLPGWRHDNKGYTTKQLQINHEKRTVNKVDLNSRVF